MCAHIPSAIVTPILSMFIDPAAQYPEHGDMLLVPLIHRVKDDGDFGICFGLPDVAQDVNGVED
jgi:hypothetical protein